MAASYMHATANYHIYTMMQPATMDCVLYVWLYHVWLVCAIKHVECGMSVLLAWPQAVGQLLT